MGVLLPSIPNNASLKESSARKEAQPDCLTYLLRQGREQAPQTHARTLPRLGSLPKELTPTTGTDSIAEKLARLAQVHSVGDVSWTDRTSYQPQTLCQSDCLGQTTSKRSSWEGSPHEGSWDMQPRGAGRREPHRSSNGSLARSPRHQSLLHGAEVAESLISFLIGTQPSTGMSRSRKNSLSSRRSSRLEDAKEDGDVLSAHSRTIKEEVECVPTTNDEFVSTIHKRHSHYAVPRA